MAKRMRNSPPAHQDNLPAEIVREQWTAIEQRNRAERDLEDSSDPELARPRTIARAARRGLRVSVPVEAEQCMSQPLPFEPLARAGLSRGDWWIGEPLPEYVDWKSFVWANGPGRGFADWLGKLLCPCADVILDEVIGPGAPVIAERARPPLPDHSPSRQQEIVRRMSEFPVLAHKPGGQAPWKGMPMRQMVVAYAVDIHGLTDLDAAVALTLDDFKMVSKEMVLVDHDLGSRGGRRYLEKGRTRLANLGAWPWCMAPEGGRPPPNWQVKQEYAEALARWHYPQWLAAYVANEEGRVRLLDSVGAVALHASVSRTSSTQRPMEAARAAYREWYCDSRA